MIYRCRGCDCCYAEFADVAESQWCTGCYANYGRRAECDDCPKHTLLYEPGRDGHREKDIILSAKDAPFQEIDAGVRIEPDESPRGWDA